MIKENNELLYENCTITKFERNYYDDSDFFALVYDIESDSVKEVMTGTTRCAYDSHVVCDITEENSIRAIESLERVYAENFDRIFDATLKAQKKIIDFGDTVIIARGRKVPKGTIARVVGFYANDYDRENPSVKLEIANGSVAYTYIKNIDRVVDSEKIGAIIKSYKVCLHARILDELKKLTWNGFTKKII